jgi:carbon-monoxide dehydrogenase medium subunit
VPDPGHRWLAPSSQEEALALRAEHGEAATVLAGGTFLGILMNQGFLAPDALLSLGRVPELRGIEARADGELRLGAMATHREVERSPLVREGWPALAATFGVVASRRVRNQATVGGVLADADYASDPPAMLTALRARAVLRSARGEREVPVDELILGYYETCIAPEELLVEVRVPPAPERAVYRKFRSRSQEDRPCVSVAATHGEDGLRVVVGAVAETPQHYADVCALADGAGLGAELAMEVGRRYAERIEPLEDARGSAAYRRRITGVEVRRAIEDLARNPGDARGAEGHG